MTSSCSQNNRERLPETRRSITHKIIIHAQPETIEAFLTVGLFEDGRPGEIFISMRTADEGLQGMAKSFCTALSLCLQYGIPVEHIVRKFMHWRFPPEGFTGFDQIPFAKSLTDYIARWLELTFKAGGDGPDRHGALPQEKRPSGPLPCPLSTTQQPAPSAKKEEKETMHEKETYHLGPNDGLFVDCKGGPYNIPILPANMTEQEKKIHGELLKSKGGQAQAPVETTGPGSPPPTPDAEPEAPAADPEGTEAPETDDEDEKGDL